MPHYLKNERFTFACNSEERRILDALATALQRTRADTVRWLIRSASSNFIDPQPTISTQPEPVHAAPK